MPSSATATLAALGFLILGGESLWGQQTHNTSLGETSLAFILLIALALMFKAVVQSKRKVHTFLFILGCAIAASTFTGVLAFLLAALSHAGNPPAVAGDLAGPALTLTLLLSSVNRLRANRIAKSQKQCDHVSEVGNYCAKCGTNLSEWEKRKTPEIAAVAPLPLNLPDSVTEMVNEYLETNKWLLNCKEKGSLHEYEQYLVKRIEGTHQEIATKCDGKMNPLDGFHAVIAANLLKYGVYFALINLLSANLKQLSKERALYLFQTFQADKDCFNESWPTFNIDTLRENVLGNDGHSALGSDEDWKETLGGYSYEQAILGLALEIESDRYWFEMSLWYKAILVPLAARVKGGSAFLGSWFTEKFLPQTKEAAQNYWNRLAGA